MNRQRVHWDNNDAYSFGQEHAKQVADTGLEDDELSLLEEEKDIGFYLSEAKEAISKLNQHEARRAKTPQRMRGKSVWE